MRKFISFCSGGWVLGGVISANVLMFAVQLYHYKRHNSIMEKYVVLSRKNILEKKYWTIILSGFAHISPGHLIGNMFMIYCFGKPLIMKIGTCKFLFLYFASKIFTAPIQLFFKDTMSVGASTSAFGLMVPCLSLASDLEMTLFGFTLSKETFFAAIVFAEMYDIVFKPNSATCHISHFAGLMSGAIFSLVEKFSG